MTDAHCHVCVPGATRRFLCPLADTVHFGEMHPQEEGGSPRGRISPKCATENNIFFWGVHPWYLDGPLTVADVRARLEADPRAGVGEIGLDRLRDRTISDRMREVFEAQLRLAVEFHRPVVLHGAKCWGEVVKTIRRVYVSLGLSPSPTPSPSTSNLQPSTSVPPLLFHGFSRSDGLLPDIVAMNGFVSVGPAVLNDHAVNYRALVKKIPTDRLLVETDATAETVGALPALEEIARKVAEIRGITPDRLAGAVESNAERFLSGAHGEMRPIVI